MPTGARLPDGAAPVAMSHPLEPLLAARAVAAIGRFLHTQRAKVDAIVDGRADRGDAMLRPHVRFDGGRLAELPERWAHAQNDALGYWMWLVAQLAQAGRWVPSPEDIDLLAALVRYLQAIAFWEDEDSGHWEEARNRGVEHRRGDGRTGRGA